jgi:signal transduction histidine kinase
MRLRSLRARVALAAAAAIAVAIVALGTAAIVLVGRELHDNLDRTLRQRASDVARLSATTPALLTAPGALEAPLSGTQLVVEVLDDHGRIVARSPSLGTNVLEAPRAVHEAITQGRATYAGLSLGPTAMRAYVAPLAETGGPASGGAVVVAGSTSSVDDILRHLRVLVIVAAVGAALLGAGVATASTGRALRPVRRLSQAAANIERTQDASRRLPDPGTGDEVEALATTLNRMLSSLESARQAERRFLADASHELRTPLTALRGNAAYIARHGADPAVLASIEEDAERLSRLLADLLALAREDAAAGGPREPVRLDDLVRRAAAADPRIDADADGPVVVTGDEEALRRALDNLVENARVHGPEGGRIRIWAARDDGVARLGVEDDGPGIAPADVERAFRRFWRADEARSRPGSGLGLAIVQATAQRHGGQVQVRGARIEMTLPLSTGSQEAVIENGPDRSEGTV